MAYYLHIERADDRPIALDEWRAAVCATDGVRLFGAPERSGMNPTTGEILRMSANEGDAEVFFADTNEWGSVFRWRDDSALFAARFDTTDTSHPVWAAAVALAVLLGAVIRGDEGEVYDFETGEIARPVSGDP